MLQQPHAQHNSEPTRAGLKRSKAYLSAWHAPMLITMLLGSMTMMSDAAAISFSPQRVALEHPANGGVLVAKGQPYIWVSGHNSESRWLSEVDSRSGQARQLGVPASAQFFAQADIAGQPQSQLVVLTNKGISRFDRASTQWLPLVEVSSMYRVIDSKRLLHMAFSHDLNQDQLSDFLVPDFAGWHYVQQQADGSFRQQFLAVDPLMELFDERPTYKTREPRLVDVNLDGKTDVVFSQDDQLHVFLQQADGQLSERQSWPLQLGLTPDVQAQMRGGDGRSYAGLVITRLERVQDINADGIPDAVVQQRRYVNAMEQQYSYLIHYGQQQAQRLVFSKAPSQRIDSKGVQFEVQFDDLNGDGRLDFYTPAAEIGVSSIVRALVSGSASVDLLFYVQRPDGRFMEKPTYRQELTVNISISKGSVSLPLFKLVKDNTGATHLVLASDDDELRMFAPVPAQLFSEKSNKLNLTLPQNGELVQAADLNQDGRTDLVLAYGSQEASSEHNHQLQILRQLAD